MTSVKMVRLGKKGQMVLPKEIRDALSLQEGDSLMIALQEEGSALLTTPERYAAVTKGMLKGTWGPAKKQIERYLKGERASWENASG